MFEGLELRDILKAIQIKKIMDYVDLEVLLEMPGEEDSLSQFLEALKKNGPTDELKKQFKEYLNRSSKPENEK